MSKCLVDNSSNQGIGINGTACHVAGCRVYDVAAARIAFSSHSAACTAIGNQDVAGYISDNGSDNVWQGLNS